MAFAIMRFEKLKTGIPINGAVSHITRSRPTPNADPARRHLNRTIVGPADTDSKAIREAIEERTPAKFRKDAVRVMEFMISASPEWFRDAPPERIDQYFDSAVDWLRSEFGSANVVSAIQHNDETTPHMHALVVPVNPETGRLNSKRWVGGRGKLREMQSTFADWQSTFGVERGKPRPGRKHTRVSDWYDGHARLDEREASLKERESSAQAEREAAVADRRAADKTLAEAKTERAELKERIHAATEEAKSWDAELQAREATLEQREEEAKRTAEKQEAAQRQFQEQRKALDERGLQLATQAQNLEQREEALQEHQSAIEQREAAVAVQEQRLRILERELAERGDRLSTEGGALGRRQAEIDAAGEQLRERLDAMRSWADQHRPEDADLLEGKPRPLPGALRQMVGDEAADWHDQGLDDLPQPPPRRGGPNGLTL